ncbi:SMP-30/gluconolactonase/LRE family protein [Novosphingobium terrae]|uniref:SMP-30/gluconolactonase/LRE family protein n=1 Tax=Novosphingobium terrae TaxID=2726189 RepID=UPI001981BD1F|nr:SMP-30/gluconolactonase/LRE family protein [Novosphingobium terrae]
MQFSRRSALAAAGGLAVSSMMTKGPAMAAETSAETATPLKSLDPAFARCVDAHAVPKRLATGFTWAEGPVWLPGSRALVFSDIRSNRMMRWDEATGAVSEFRKPANNANGNTIDRQGRLVTCQHLTASITRTEHDGSITTLASTFEGKRFNSPNDIVCTSDGAIWFTDPAFGPNPVEGMQAPMTTGRIYRIDPHSGAVTMAMGDMPGPNGLVFSPDEAALYVVEARAVPHRLLVRYDVVDGGKRLANRRVIFDCGAGLADGFRVDTQGNLWCGWGGGPGLDGVAVISPARGVMIGHIALPERCANLAFGGEDRRLLLMAASTSLYAMRVKAQGVAGR